MMNKLIAYKLMLVDTHATAKKVHGSYAIASVYDRIKRLEH
jgi:hypothetical protein